MNLLVSGVIVLIVGSINFFSDHLMMVFRLLDLFACLVPGLYLFFIKTKLIVSQQRLATERK